MGQDRRRQFLIASSALLAFPQLSWAQHPGRTYLVGALLGPSSEGSRQVRAVLAERLATHGFIEGRNLRIEVRFSTLSSIDVQTAVREILALNPDAIFTAYTATAEGARKATKSVPIVFTWVTDPIASGFVETLARPGGNATGITERNAELFEKRLELALEIVPGAKHVAYLGADTSSTYLNALRPGLMAAARRANVEVIEVPAADALGWNFVRGIAQAKKQGAQFVLTGWSLVAFGLQQVFEAMIAQSLEVRLPVMSVWADDVEAGALISYGVFSFETTRLGADQLARILNGANPANLPVDQAARFELAVNLKTAKALGLTIPRSIMLRADRVIG